MQLSNDTNTQLEKELSNHRANISTVNSYAFVKEEP